jgi:hypothetical protein
MYTFGQFLQKNELIFPKFCILEALFIVIQNLDSIFACETKSGIKIYEYGKQRICIRFCAIHQT